jgi:hypothetical protein
VNGGTVVAVDACDVVDDDEGFVPLLVVLGLLLLPHPTASKTTARKMTPFARDVRPLRTHA